MSGSSTSKKMKKWMKSSSESKAPTSHKEPKQARAVRKTRVARAIMKTNKIILGNRMRKITTAILTTITIPLTINTVTRICEGVIKAGWTIDSAKVTT